MHNLELIIRNTDKKYFLSVAFLFLLVGFNPGLASQNFSLSYYHSIDIKDNPHSILGNVFSKMPASNSMGVDNGTYWFRLSIDTNGFSNNAIVYIPTHNIDKIELYRLVDGNLEYIAQTGNLVRKEDLTLDYKFPAFSIQHKDIGKTYYMKVSFPKGANFPLKIISEKSFESNKTDSLVYLSLFYGISIVVLLLHLVYFFKFKNPYYLYYFGFLFTLILNLLIFDGTLIHVLRPFSHQGNAELVLHLIEEAFLLAFSIHFLGLQKRMPIFTKVAYSFPLLLAIAYISFTFTNNFKIVAIADAIGISTMMILWGIGILYWHKDPYAKLYVLGYLILMPLGMYYFIGYGFGWWPVSGEDSIVKIGSIVDMMVFTYAITFRMKLKADNDKNKLLALEKEIESVKSAIEKQDPYFIFLKNNPLTETPLTLKEVEVLQRICEELTNPQIAEKLFISLSTVKTHNRNIFRKFGVASRKELISLISSKPQF
jgi:DNA-binding CsgD family transcriptional regulator